MAIRFPLLACCFLAASVVAPTARAQETESAEEAVDVAADVTVDDTSEDTATEQAADTPAMRLAVEVQEVQVPMEELSRVLAAAPGKELATLLAELDGQGLAPVIQRLQLVTNDGQAATIQIGKRIPVSRGRANAGGRTITQTMLENVGTMLEIDPTTHLHGARIELSYETSSLVAATSDDEESPTITTQQIHTTVDVGYKQPTVIAGAPSYSGSVLVLTVTPRGSTADQSPDQASSPPAAGESGDEN